MSSVILTIKSLIQEADTFKTTDAWTCLKVEKPSCYLINDADLAREILKSDAFSPEQIIDFWKLINRLDYDSLPNLTQYFQQIPLLLSGRDQIEARDTLRGIYQGIEKTLDLTLAEANHSFFISWQDKQAIDPTEFIISYLDYINRAILAKELLVKTHQIPSFDGVTLFRILPTASGLKNYENKLDILIKFIHRQLKILGRSSHEVWPLVSIAVMGQEPLSGALAYGLLHSEDQSFVWSGEDLAFYSAPASLFSRVVNQNLFVGDLQLAAGDLVVISPIICNNHSIRNNGESGRSMSFGHGAHACTGRKIATRIIDLFFSSIKGYSLDLNLTALGLERDFGLMPVKV